MASNARLVISASPLVKVYLPQWHERLLDEPDLIFREYSNDEPTFTFDIPRGIKAFKMTFNKPVAVHGSDDKEIESLYQWLIGEMAQSQHETDCYGVVPFDPNIDMVGTLDHMASLEALASGDAKKALRAKQELDKIQKDIGERMSKLRTEVKKQSEARIKRAMKTNHNNLIRQWQTNVEQGLGKYPPSIAEALGRHALDKEIAVMESKQAKLARFMEADVQQVGKPQAARA